jgi:vacuolar-type H+-ATPase subunit F/Vma7
MKRIYVIGDIHTVTAFRLGGLHGLISSADGIREDLMTVLRDDEAGIVLITRELSVKVRDIIDTAGPEGESPAVVEIPGINGGADSAASVLGHLISALGISI